MLINENEIHATTRKRTIKNPEIRNRPTTTPINKRKKKREIDKLPSYPASPSQNHNQRGSRKRRTT